MPQFDPMVLGDIVLRTLTVYIALLVGLRMAGKLELGQMSPFDLVVILVISNTEQNAMVSPDTSLSAGLVAAATLLSVHWFVGWLRQHFGWFERGVRGTPTILIDQGQFVYEHLRREGPTPDEVVMALREHGVDEPGDVKIAVLEVDGTISVVPIGKPVRRTSHRFWGWKPVGWGGTRVASRTEVSHLLGVCSWHSRDSCPGNPRRQSSAFRCRCRAALAKAPCVVDIDVAVSSLPAIVIPVLGTQDRGAPAHTARA